MLAIPYKPLKMLNINTYSTMFMTKAYSVSEFVNNISELFENFLIKRKLIEKMIFLNKIVPSNLFLNKQLI